MTEEKTEKRIVTLRGEGRSRLEEKRSVFLGYVTPTDSEEEAQAFVKRIKGAYPDASHHVWAYYLDDGVKCRYSDDGEPQGTAGMPVLDVIRKAGLTNVCAVVVRYFGGTLLGAGGLVRAYGETCKSAIDAAGVAVFYPFALCSFVCSYAEYQKITPVLPSFSARVENVTYTDAVTVSLVLPQKRFADLDGYISDLTAGRVRPRQTGTRMDCDP